MFWTASSCPCWSAVVEHGHILIRHFVGEFSNKITAWHRLVSEYVTLLAMTDFPPGACVNVCWGGGGGCTFWLEPNTVAIRMIAFRWAAVGGKESPFFPLWLLRQTGSHGITIMINAFFFLFFSPLSYMWMTQFEGWTGTWWLLVFEWSM